jgi:hypothetical protein
MERVKDSQPDDLTILENGIIMVSKSNHYGAVYARDHRKEHPARYL